MFENVPAFIPMLFGSASCLVCLAPTILMIAAGTALSAGSRRFGKGAQEEGQPEKISRRRRQSAAAQLDYHRYTDGAFRDFIQY